MAGHIDPNSSPTPCRERARGRLLRGRCRLGDLDPAVHAAGSPGRRIVVRTMHVVEAVPELIAAIVFLVVLRFLGPRGIRMGALCGAVILCGISMALFDRLVIGYSPDCGFEPAAESVRVDTAPRLDRRCRGWC